MLRNMNLLNGRQVNVASEKLFKKILIFADHPLHSKTEVKCHKLGRLDLEAVKCHKSREIRLTRSEMP